MLKHICNNTLLLSAGSLNITTVGDVMPRLVPVELNAYMIRFESNLASFYEEIGAFETKQHFINAMRIRAEAMDKFMWNGTINRWEDLTFESCNGINHNISQAHRSFECSSSFLPLWAGWKFMTICIDV